LRAPGGDLRWNQGLTSFSEGLVFPLKVGVQRRNTSGGLTNLVA
jgi:hypothetical protein